ncbi:hypothetical protein ITI46_13930 [Streptomyces oryzae]|uniref:Integral membrane protein n=1 Tax=Streptomyces oryzae TaxID=1434886 RepID=A0ABS3XBL4_9ACTN|nr:hypothetical protein [Streptomyces oryzae]MBO8192758.1 hypothetical protein [Streptomyces oryzae]
MTSERPDQPSQQPTGYGPWWSELNAVGGIVLILLGIGTAVFLFLGPWKPQEHLGVLHGAAKIVAIGLVVAGTALMARRRGGVDG